MPAQTRPTLLEGDTMIQTVEEARNAVESAANKLTSIWDVTKANGWTQHHESLDALIAAVRAEEQAKRDKLVTALQDVIDMDGISCTDEACDCEDAKVMRAARAALAGEPEPQK